jgi:thioesterase domain-containing protein
VFETRTPALMTNWLADIGAVGRVARSMAPGGGRLIRLREGSGEFTLILAHSLAGEVYAFDALSSHLPHEASVYAFEAAEIDGSSTESIEAMAAPLTAQLADLDPRGRFCLAGYSFGGLVAFEVARQWVASGRPTPLVAVIDTGPAPPPRSVRSVSADLLRAIGNLPWWLWYDIVKGPKEIIASDARRKLRVIRRRALAWREGDRTRGKLQPDDIFDVRGLSEKALDDMQRRLGAASRYRPQPYPGAITLFKARARPLTRALEPDLGWRRVVLGGVEVRRVPGNHRSMMQSPYVESLARRLGELISRGTVDN